MMAEALGATVTSHEIVTPVAVQTAAKGLSQAASRYDNLPPRSYPIITSSIFAPEMSILSKGEAAAMQDQQKALSAMTIKAAVEITRGKRPSTGGNDVNDSPEGLAELARSLRNGAALTESFSQSGDREVFLGVARDLYRENLARQGRIGEVNDTVAAAWATLTVRQAYSSLIGRERALSGYFGKRPLSGDLPMTIPISFGERAKPPVESDIAGQPAEDVSPLSNKLSTQTGRGKAIVIEAALGGESGAIEPPVRAFQMIAEAPLDKTEDITTPPLETGEVGGQGGIASNPISDITKTGRAVVPVTHSGETGSNNAQGESNPLPHSLTPEQRALGNTALEMGATAGLDPEQLQALGKNVIANLASFEGLSEEQRQGMLERLVKEAGGKTEDEQANGQHSSNTARSGAQSQSSSSTGATGTSSPSRPNQAANATATVDAAAANQAGTTADTATAAQTNSTTTGTLHTPTAQHATATAHQPSSPDATAATVAVDTDTLTPEEMGEIAALLKEGNVRGILDKIYSTNINKANLQKIQKGLMGVIGREEFNDIELQRALRDTLFAISGTTAEDYKKLVIATRGADYEVKAADGVNALLNALLDPDTKNALRNSTDQIALNLQKVLGGLDEDQRMKIIESLGDIQGILGKKGMPLLVKLLLVLMAVSATEFVTTVNPLGKAA